MKSSQEALRKRGLANKEEIASLSGYPLEKLLTILHNDKACMRTAAAVNLAPFADQAANALLLQLFKESRLYTKIAICESLEKGNAQTAYLMTSYLGKIGKNQHRKLPKKVSEKISFPLPRDIVARSLAKMDISILPILIEVTEGTDRDKICEVLDAIGYMVFYHPDLATEDTVRPILSLLSTCSDQPLVLWKVLLCLSAFPLPGSKAALLDFEAEEGILGMEARRSLGILEKRAL